DIGGIDLGSTVRFEGTTKEGYLVELSDAMVVGSNMHSSKIDGYRHELRLLCSNVHIRASSNEKASCIRFYLVNFEFDGIQSYHEVYEDGTKAWNLELPLEINGRTLTIRPVREYSNIIKVVKATNWVDVTCVATVELDENDNLNDVREEMDSLCALLTLARGT